MCEILLTDSSSKPFREVKKFLPKNTEEEGILASLLLSCLKRGAGISEMADVDLKLAAQLSKKKVPQTFISSLLPLFLFLFFLF